MMEAINSSETSALTRATWFHFPEYVILHSPRRENLRSDMEKTTGGRCNGDLKLYLSGVIVRRFQT
jgi:hypothetical protein